MPTPYFNMYNPSKQHLNKDQLAFYKNLKKKLEKGDHINIEGNISYVFLYLYEPLNKWNEIGYKNLSEHLIHISELYRNEEKLSNYCLTWAYDCLLGQKKYMSFLEKTEAIDIQSNIHHHQNLRLNIQKHLNLEPDAIDIILLALRI